MTTRTQPDALTSDELAAIRALRPAFNALMRAFDADLLRQHALSHTEYLVLMYLSEADEYTLRLSDLAAACQQSLSAVSRTVGRLAAAGLVERQQAAGDGRSFEAVLTAAGRSRFTQAQKSHLVSVRRYLFDNLGSVDVAALAAALERIAAQVNAGERSRSS